MRPPDRKTPSALHQLLSIFLLPFMVTVAIPLAIYDPLSELTFDPLPEIVRYGLGILCLSLGFPLFVQSVILFIKIGKGTLAPWNPTRKLVARSLYRHMRNPMITGVFLIVLSEAFLFHSGSIVMWAFVFLLINHLYFILKEEPDLEKRFGEEYREYKKHVPRWLPRLRGWRPEG